MQPEEGNMLKLRGVGDFGGDIIDSALDITLTGDDGDYGSDAATQTSVIFNNNSTFGGDEISKAYRFKGLARDVLIKDGVGLFSNTAYKVNLVAPAGLTTDYNVSFPLKTGNVVISDSNKAVADQINSLTLGNASTGDGFLSVSARAYYAAGGIYSSVANTFKTGTRAVFADSIVANIGGIILNSRAATTTSTAAIYCGSKRGATTVFANTSFESDLPIDFKLLNVTKLSVNSSGAVVPNGNSVRFNEATANGTNYTDLIGQANLTANNIVTLPATTGTLVTRENLSGGEDTGVLADIYASTSIRAPFITGDVFYTDAYIMGENSVITYDSGVGSDAGVVLKPIIGSDSGGMTYLNSGFMIYNRPDNSGAGLALSEFKGLIVKDDTNGPKETRIVADGIILQAPNGSKWKLTVSNTGALITVAA